MFLSSILSLALSASCESNSFGIDRAELREMAQELAPKVNLFRDVWALDPEAKFYAGTARDFVYWILRQFQNQCSEHEKEQVKAALKLRKNIDILEIIGLESDVDILSIDQTLLQKINPEDYRLRKIDFINADRLNLNSVAGQDELKQGFIPVEKMRLGSSGIALTPEFGDPLSEILSGHLTVSFSKEKDFYSTSFAKQGINHPALLALRYIRLVAQDYFNRYGMIYPDQVLLTGRVRGELGKVESVFRAALTDPEWKFFLEQPKSIKWLNATLLKAFRSYTNPSATFALLKQSGFLELQAKNPEIIESLNQFLFLKRPNLIDARRKFKEFQVEESSILIPLEELVPDRTLFHGTRSEEAFRAIIFQGVLPSRDGMAGAGLYAVKKDELKTALNYSGGDENLVLKFHVSRTARIIDVRKGSKGGELYEEWFNKRAGHGVLSKGRSSYDSFSEEFGADILIYDLSPTAFVIKNSGVLMKAEGYKRKLLTISQLEGLAQKIRTQTEMMEFLNLLIFNSISGREVKSIAEMINLKLTQRQWIRIWEKLEPNFVPSPQRTLNPDWIRVWKLVNNLSLHSKFHFLNLSRLAFLKTRLKKIENHLQNNELLEARREFLDTLAPLVANFPQQDLNELSEWREFASKILALNFSFIASGAVDLIVKNANYLRNVLEYERLPEVKEILFVFLNETGLFNLESLFPFKDYLAPLAKYRELRAWLELDPLRFAEVLNSKLRSGSSTQKLRTLWTLWAHKVWNIPLKVDLEQEMQKNKIYEDLLEAYEEILDSRDSELVHQLKLGTFRTRDTYILEYARLVSLLKKQDRLERLATYFQQISLATRETNFQNGFQYWDLIPASIQVIKSFGDQTPKIIIERLLESESLLGVGSQDTALRTELDTVRCDSVLKTLASPP